jgi:Flp pilus assembly pilin Flp
MRKLTFPFKRRRSTRSKALSSFLRDRSGVVAIEFAMLIVPFTLLLAGIFEDGLAYFRTVQLQNVAQTAARQLRLNAASSLRSPKEFRDNFVCSPARRAGTLGPMFDCKNVVVVISAASSWGSAGWNLPTNLALATTSTSSINMPKEDEIGVLVVIYKANIVIPSFKDVLGGFSRDNSTYYPSGRAAFRVEPST